MSAPEKPWELEPDELKWIDPATGLRCRIRRTSIGHLCGYVRVPHGPLKRRLTRRMRMRGGYLMYLTLRKSGYSYAPLATIAVHGGLTYCERFRDARGLWIGFGCGHFGDLSPNLFFGHATGTYRDMNYVKGEVTALAHQLAPIAGITLREPVLNPWPVPEPVIEKAYGDW